MKEINDEIWARGCSDIYQNVTMHAHIQLYIYIMLYTLLGLVQGAMVIGPAVAYIVGGIMLTWYTDFPTIGQDE